MRPGRRPTWRSRAARPPAPLRPEPRPLGLLHAAERRNGARRPRRGGPRRRRRPPRPRRRRAAVAPPPPGRCPAVHPGTTEKAPSTSSTVGSVGGSRSSPSSSTIVLATCSAFTWSSSGAWRSGTASGPTTNGRRTNDPVADVEGLLGRLVLVHHQADLRGGGRVDGVADRRAPPASMAKRSATSPIRPASSSSVRPPMSTVGQLDVARHGSRAGVDGPGDHQHDQHEQRCQAAGEQPPALRWRRLVGLDHGSGARQVGRPHRLG